MGLWMVWGIQLKLLKHVLFDALLIIMNSDHFLFTSTPHSSLDLIDRHDCNDSTTMDDHINHRQDATDDEDCSLKGTGGVTTSFTTVRWRKPTQRIQWTEQLIQDLEVLYYESRTTKQGYIDQFQSLWAKNHPALPAKTRRVKVQAEQLSHLALRAGRAATSAEQTGAERPHTANEARSKDRQSTSEESQSGDGAD